MGGLFLPLAPDIQVTGVEPSTANMFKSALCPALLEFHVHSGHSLIKDKKERGNMKLQKKDIHKVIVKVSIKNMRCKSPLFSSNYSNSNLVIQTRDDLCQDQLVIALIKLMDKILKRGALHLRLKPYDILATGPKSGLVEFIQNSVPIQQILEQKIIQSSTFSRKMCRKKGLHLV